MAKKVAKNKKEVAETKVSAALKAYEVSLVVDPNLDDAKREKLVESFRKIVSALGGQIDKTEEAGKKVLAYPINKFNEAWYYFFDVQLPSDKARDLNSKITFEEQVIRHLVVRAD